MPELDYQNEPVLDDVTSSPEQTQDQPVAQPSQDVQNTAQEQPQAQQEQEQVSTEDKKDIDVSKYIGTPETNATYDYDKMNFDRRVEKGEIKIEDQDIQQVQTQQQPQDQSFSQSQNQSHKASNTIDDFLDKESFKKIEEELYNKFDQKYPEQEEPNAEDFKNKENGAIEYMRAINAHDRYVAERETAKKDFGSRIDSYLWDRVYEKYPSLEKSPNTDRMIKNIYAGAKSRGEDTTPLKVASEFISYQSNIRQSARNSANTTRRVVQSFPRPVSSSISTPNTSQKASIDDVSSAGSDPDKLADILSKL